MGPINKGKIFLKAAFRALVAGAEDLPLVGLPIKMGRVFYDQWIAGLKQAQDAVPEIERPLQLEAAAICTPAEAKVLALEVISETKSQGRVLSQAQEEAVLDVATVFPARVRERTHATLDHAKSQGTAAHVALPVSAKAPVLEREDFYRSLLPLRRPQFRTGDHLPHYNPEWRLVELIGAGGFGEVWLARHDYLGETRAIKFCQDPTGMALLRREAENIKLLRQNLPDHPNIVRLHDLQFKLEPYWLSFEYVPGGTLESLMRVKVFTWQEAIAFLTPVLQAMAEIHRLGIVHRDIKPSNILLDVNGKPKIGDFGIGKIMAERDAKDLRTNRLHSFTALGYGSWGYMSKEQEEGEQAHSADDTYAFGVVMWQMLTGAMGRIPFYPDDIESLSIPDTFKVLLMSCRFSPRNKRPQDAGVLLKHLIQVSIPAPQQALPQVPTISSSNQNTSVTSDALPVIPPIKPLPSVTAVVPELAASDIVKGKFIIHANGTVTDTETGLMWKICPEGYTWNGKNCVGDIEDLEHMCLDEAVPNGLQKPWPAFAGYNDWRVPTIKEFRTILKELPTIIFQYQTTIAEYIMALDKNHSGDGWCISGGTSIVYELERDSYLASVQLVRGG